VQPPTGTWVPDLDRAVVARRGQHRAVGAERDQVDVHVVADERADALAGAGVADVDQAALLGALGHEQPPVRAPVQRAAEAGDAQHDPGGDNRPVQRLPRLGEDGAVCGTRVLDGLEREEDAALEVSKTGVTINTYARAGNIDYGSFAFDEPTEAEIERRRRLADG
jgi:hypothetical protein